MEGYNIDIAKGQPFLAWAVSYFAGAARISFEGKFSPEDFTKIVRGATSPDPIVGSQPSTRVLVLPLEDETKEDIVRTVLPRIGLRRNVYHVLIYKNETLVLGVYDNLHDCWASPTVDPKELEKLVSLGVIQSFRSSERAT